MYFNGALSLQPEGLRPITSLSTLDRHGCPYRPKTRYQVRWVTASWAALTAASKHSASWRTTCQYHPEGCGWNCEEIKCDDFFAMVLKKYPPRLRWRSAARDYVLRDRGLRNLNPELQQLSVDPRRAPQRISPTHAPDQVPDLRINPWASAAATLPAPVVPEPLSVPA